MDTTQCTQPEPAASGTKPTAKGVAHFALGLCDRHSWSSDSVYRRVWRKALPPALAAEALEVVRSRQAELPTLEHLLPEAVMRETTLVYSRAVALLAGGAA